MAAIRLLVTAAILVDVYLAWVSLSGGAIAGCGPESNCHVVLNSKWAYWFGIPVSAPALLVYGALLAATFYLASDVPAPSRRRAWQILIAGSAAVAGAAAWFVFLQFFALNTICPYCMAAHGCGLAAAILILANAPVREAPKKAALAAQFVFVRPRMAVQLYLGAAAAIAVMATGQVIQRPKAFVSNAISAGVTTNALAPTVREFQIFDGQFKFNLDDVPLIGRPDARHAIVSLFDYTCHHCREMHKPLMEAHRTFSNELAIVSLPMPLDGKCNPIVKRTLAPHVNACALARLGLIVWRADRQAWAKFEDWVFAPNTPPLPTDAERYAKELIGVAAFNQAATNSWVDAQIRQDIAIYEAVYRRYRKGYMPAVIIGTNLLSGAFGRDQLFNALSAQLGLKTD